MDARAFLDRGAVRLDDVGLEYRFAKSVGVGGVDAAAVAAALPRARAAAGAFRALLETGEAPCMDEAVLWPRVTPPEQVAPVQAWAARARGADVVLSIGIGGSYLGNRVLRDALLGTTYNARPRAARGDWPELHFAGFHLDPAESRDLVDLVRAKAAAAGRPLRVVLLAISKSGTTTETLASTLGLLRAMQEVPGVKAELAALTAPGSVLSELVRAKQGEELPFPEGIGGRWSVLTPVGLVTAAVSGVDVGALLDGARAAQAAIRAADGDPGRDPALLYALLHHLHAGQGRAGAVFMPYSERLRSVSEWYVQLLAESLGKEKDRQGQVVHAGRTPIVAVGTTDMHAQTQLHQEGPHDKTVTTLDVADWGPATVADRVPDEAVAGKLAGKTFAQLNTLAREANEDALRGSGRPSDAWVLDRLDARGVGALLYTLMASVAYEGELMDVCAYDQPGVEAYKKIMKARL
ncbi:MAG: glucose-6-phosphate isomerase [Planctomycetes bacterium]|nr:glucose-6-phosphate isomerase [Planctomycetota bacterium]